VRGDARSGGTRFVARFLEKLDRLVPLLFTGPDGRPLRLTDYQLRFARAALSRVPGKYLFVACTRCGKTTVTAVVAVLFAMLYPREEVVVVAPTFKQTQILFGRMREMIVSSPLLMALVDKERSFRRDFIAFRNGSTLRALSAGNPESLLGFGATVLIVDEAGSIPDEVFKTRILRMIMSPSVRDRRPVLILLGTPHVMNYFYEAWQSDEFWKIRVTWRDAVRAGIMQREEVEFARRMLSENEFRMWYEAEFTSPEGLFFDMVQVRKCARGVAKRENTPVKPAGVVRVLGVDVARLGNDETAVAVVEAPEGFNLEEGTAEVVAWYTRRKKYLSEIIGWLDELIRRWEPDLVAIDVVGIGAGVYDVLRERFGELLLEMAPGGRERVEMFTSVRRLINECRLILPSSDYVVEQFGSYRVKYTSDGQVRIVKTPGYRDDVADAIIYAVWALLRMRRSRVYVWESFDEYMRIIGGMSVGW